MFDGVACACYKRGKKKGRTSKRKNNYKDAKNGKQLLADVGIPRKGWLEKI